MDFLVVLIAAPPGGEAEEHRGALAGRHPRAGARRAAGLRPRDAVRRGDLELRLRAGSGSMMIYQDDRAHHMCVESRKSMGVRKIMKLT